MIIVLIGKSCSGKNKAATELYSKYGFSRIVTYSTRPKRKGEIDGIAYHFITKEDFKQKIDEGFFAEWKSYTTVEGIWYYGTALEDLENAEDESVIILTPDGFRDVKDKLGDRVSSIYIYANNSTIKKRLSARGDNPEEAKRRLEHDNEDFKGVENEVDRIVYNNDGTDIEDVVKKILEFLEVK
jgi:guanylate kinase